ncbi:MAG: hypothetical protein KY464_07035 [Gemmatimonadetes bacterium]|nr:hypothetical protein [Gemmatimonadota bacterium]
MAEPGVFDSEGWCALTFAEHRALLAEALRAELDDYEAVTDVVIEAGTLGREYDLTAMIETDVGRLRTPLWAHARAAVFCDPSVHPANRRQLAPDHAVREAADRLRRRLSVAFALESRGLTLTMAPEDGVERVWTAERSLFRNRTAVTREDRVLIAGEVDVRDLLAHFYVGPSLRVAAEDGTAFLLPEASEVEGPLVSLCHGCGRWSEGAHSQCPHCAAVTEVVIAARPPRR